MRRVRMLAMVEVHVDVLGVILSDDPTDEEVLGVVDRLKDQFTISEWQDIVVIEVL